jgi:Flp pilus assembly protein TadD
MMRNSLSAVLLGRLLAGCASAPHKQPARPAAESALPPQPGGPLDEMESGIAAANRGVRVRMIVDDINTMFVGATSATTTWGCTSRQWSWTASALTLVR